MSETTKSTPKSKTTETAPKADSKTTADSTTPSTGKSDAGKSSRESIGGAGAVHYGFFSNVKTPQYRSGWDDIWSKNSEPKKKKSARAKQPVVISLALEDLPEDLRNGLADVARAQLKKSRISYDNRAKADAITWHIECEIKR